MNSFVLFATVAAALWLASIACGLLAVQWGTRRTAQRFAASVILAAVAMGVGYLGLQSHITYSRTVNGRGWSIDSRWFFYAPLVLGAVALTLAIWRRYKTQHVAPASDFDRRTFDRSLNP